MQDRKRKALKDVASVVILVAVLYGGHHPVPNEGAGGRDPRLPGSRGQPFR